MLTVFVCTFWHNNIGQNVPHKMLVELTNASFSFQGTQRGWDWVSSRGQFHQYFSREFFIQKCFAELFSSFVLAKKHFCMKNALLKC